MRSESAREQRIVLYKTMNNNNISLKVPINSLQNQTSLYQLCHTLRHRDGCISLRVRVPINWVQNQTSLYQLCHTLRCISLKVLIDFLPWNCTTEALKTCTLLNFHSSRQTTERTCTHWKWMLIKSNSKSTTDEWWFCLNRKSTTDRTRTHRNGVLIKSNSNSTVDESDGSV